MGNPPGMGKRGLGKRATGHPAGARVGGRRPQRHAGSGGMLRLVLGLLVCLAVVLFAVENTQDVALTFVGVTFPAVRLPVLIFASLLVGAIAVALLGGFELARARRRVVALEEALAAERGEGPPAAGVEPAKGGVTPEAPTGPQVPR